MAKVRFGMKALINAGQYENITVDYEETEECTTGKQREMLIDRVKGLVEVEVLEIRRELKAARKAASR